MKFSGEVDDSSPARRNQQYGCYWKGQRVEEDVLAGAGCGREERWFLSFGFV